VVISIIGIAGALLAVKTGTFDFWKEESFLRRFSETIEFLHHQSVQDGEYYQLEINFEDNSYRVGLLKADEDVDQNLDVDPDAGALSLELAAFLNPNFVSEGTLIPPPSFPSLAEPTSLPSGASFTDVKTMLQGEVNLKLAKTTNIFFSPRGFSEFAVIHLELSAGQPITILINPFTGLTEIYRERRDFEWTYGQKKTQ